MGSIKDKSINDVEANAKRVARETVKDVKETVDDVTDTVEEKFEKIRHVNVTTDQKLVLVGAIAVAASVAIQNFIRKLREPERIINEVLVVKADEVVVEDPADVTDISDGPVI